MSDCNFCTLQRFRREAKREGKEVFLERKHGGVVNVYVYPKGRKGEMGKYWAAMFLNLPAQCCCDDD